MANLVMQEAQAIAWLVLSKQATQPELEAMAQLLRPTPQPQPWPPAGSSAVEKVFLLMLLPANVLPA